MLPSQALHSVSFLFCVISAAGAHLVDIPNRITDAVMIQIDPVLQMGAMAVVGMMDHFENITSEKNSEFAGINLVLPIAFGRNPFVAAGLRNNEFVHLIVKVTIQPAGHRPLFHRKDLLVLDRTEHGAACLTCSHLVNLAK